MFIRYNEAGYIWEYDTSAGQIGAGPWVKLPIDYSQLINVPPSGVQAHHATHEKGGTDVINGIITPSEVEISTHLALGSLSNNSYITWARPGLAANTSKWHELIGGTGERAFYPTDDAESIIQNPGFAMFRDGVLVVNARLAIGGKTSAYPSWRRTGTTLEAVTADNSQWVRVSAIDFIAIGGNFVSNAGAFVQQSLNTPSLFGSQTKFAGTWGWIYSYAEGQAVNQRQWRLLNYSGGTYRIESVNDDGNTVQGYVEISRNGYMTAYGFGAHGFFKEGNRPIEMGHWQSFTPVLKNSTGPISFPNASIGRFTLVGNTCTFWANFDLSGIPSLGTGLEFDYPMPASAEVIDGAMIGSVVLSNGDNVLREGNIAHTDSAKSRFLVGLLGAAGDTLRVKGVYEIADYIVPPPPLPPQPIIP